ncbi:MAG: 3-methyl-2-oxobutanoate hydroxymethyltransferase [Lentisphaerae bacterium]|jgi:3-methyl-2-oxobutanoate hydroxymethyltransferase|nr:3-methyl-2-oxobutanoate hydroxymethyltransferase [Lentisphaerota bacterium]
MQNWTVRKIRESKGGAPLATVTAYDAITGRIADDAGVALILVGDSLGTTSLGFSTTLPVTMEMMLHHVAAVRRGVQRALLVADMPFLSYHLSTEEALRNAGRFLQEAGADAVKLEGGACRAEVIRALVANGIPVMAHLGVLPQSVKASGYAAKGRTEDEVARLEDDVRAVAEAGAFCTVLECVMADVAERLTAISPVPTIGIGSGNACDGQILVIADLLGLTDGPLPRFVKRYATCGDIAKAAVAAYVADVQSRAYPGPEHVYRA